MTRLNRSLRPGLILLAMLLPVLAGSAGASDRTTAFADIDPGPRILAMGGAGIAGVQDPTAVYWNPAGLYFMRGTQVTATYDDLYGLGLAQRNFVALAVKKVAEEPVFKDNRMYLRRDLARGSAWGIGLSSVILDLGPDSYSEFMPTLAFAGGIDDKLGLGFAFSYLSAGSGLPDVSATGYTASIGAVWALPRSGRAALSVRNLISRVFWKEEVTERLRLTPTLGVAWPATDRGRVLADVSWSEGNAGPSRLSVGGEYWALPDRFAGRAGVRRFGAGSESRTVPSFGGGIRWNRVDFDYAFTADDDGPGSTHRFGLNVVLSRPE